MIILKKFTLIEGLVVLSFLMVIFSLTLPSLEKAFNHSKLIACKNSQRSVFHAMSLYIEDHNGHLPGPCGKWLVARYKTNESVSFSYFVAEYMQTKAYNKSSRFIPDFICAARSDAEAKNDIATRHQYLFPKSKGYSIARVFGSPESLFPMVPPLHSREIEFPETLIVIQDVRPDVGTTHEDLVENNLYFDGTVKTEWVQLID